MGVNKPAMTRLAVAAIVAIAAQQTVHKLNEQERRVRTFAEQQHAASDDTALMRLEYVSLREESAQARTGQQAILQWSLAAFAALFAAGLLFISNQDSVSDLAASNLAVFVMVFEIALPALSMFACLAWFGELIRMERAGSYLRGLELKLTRVSSSPRSESVDAPLRWETFLHQGANLIDIQTGKERAGKIRSRKQYVGYVGSLSIFVGVNIISLTIAVGSVYFSHRPQQIFGLPLWGAALVCATAVGIATIGPLAFIGLRIGQSGRHVLAYASIDPRSIRNSQPSRGQSAGNSLRPASDHPAQGLPGD